MVKESASKISLEEEVKTLQKHMGAIMRTVKDLKATVEAMGGKMLTKENEEIKEIMEAQRVVEEVIVANSDALKRIDREMLRLKNTKPASGTVCDVTKDTTETVEKQVEIVNKMTKKCRYFNRGYCKYNKKCRFVHPEGICKEYLKSYKCERKECLDRHPKICKWERSIGGCKRSVDCQYLHGKHDNDTSIEVKDDSVASEYQCVGCKSSWNDKTYLVGHSIRNMNIFFCLNCNDWIQKKEEVLDQGWSLLDEEGFLRNNI